MHNFLQYRTLINLWIQDYQTFYDTLVKEKDSLENRNFEALSLAVKEKNIIIQTINNHTPPNLTSFGGLNASFVNMSPMINFKNFCKNNPELTEPWEKLAKLAKECQQKNEVNAELVQLLNESSKRIYNLIKGFDPDNNIYDAKGDRTKVRHNAVPIRA